MKVCVPGHAKECTSDRDKTPGRGRAGPAKGARTLFFAAKTRRKEAEDVLYRH